MDGRWLKNRFWALKKSFEWWNRFILIGHEYWDRVLRPCNYWIQKRKSATFLICTINNLFYFKLSGDTYRLRNDIGDEVWRLKQETTLISWKAKKFTNRHTSNLWKIIYTHVRQQLRYLMHHYYRYEFSNVWYIWHINHKVN